MCDNGIPAAEKFKKEEIETQNQLQTICIRYKIRKTRPGIKFKVVPLVICAFGGGLKNV